ncbi:MAG: hypothetical protein EOP88_12460 [Verrucomicrobiaceae bacterium]|nr:MAG: hypothetical protein EOP88_12460 [Verrucomicrobiaceae bacterium]
MSTKPGHGETESGNADAVDSPEWHGKILAERERLIESGEETYLAWEIAKEHLRAELGAKPR